jgi:hypothetical protein
VTDAEKADDTAAASATRAPEPKRTRSATMRAGADAVRSRLASLLWLVAVVAALFLAVGALLVALDMNRANPIVGFVLDGARALDLGVFKDFAGRDAVVKEALTNWGIAAVVYLVVGKVLDRVVRP